MTTDLHSLPADSLLRDPRRRWVVLSGAGISAAGGIPTYRDAQGTWRHSQPIQHREFIDSAARRQRYWARSFYGWPPVHRAQPTAAHVALAGLEAAGRVSQIITQNVDRLHQRAGSQRVIDLHGRLDRVMCLNCGSFQEREAIQRQLEQLNPDMPTRDQALAPDGDADILDSLVDEFVPPSCACDGVMMPDVVFFGGSVPADTVARCRAAIDAADGLLVVGSSLQVYSGLRFCRHADAAGKPLVIMNPGRTRADDIATERIAGDCQALLPEWLAMDTPRTATSA